MQGVRISKGMPPDLTEQVAALLVEAFGQKYAFNLRPRSSEQAERLIAHGLAPDLAWIALDDTRAVIGMVGADIPGRHFSRVPFAALEEEFGFVGALMRALRLGALRLFTRAREGEWRVAALAVASRARGRGVGTALLEALTAAAREAGARTLLLEVVDTNERALSLYERLGFKTTRVMRTGTLTAGAGYRGVTFMRRELV